VEIVPPLPDLLASWVAPEIGGLVGGPLTLVKKKKKDMLMKSLGYYYQHHHDDFLSLPGVTNNSKRDLIGSFSEST